MYGEAAAFAPLQPGAGAASVTLDITSLVQAHKAPTALLVPYDADRFYEPVRADIQGTSVQGDLPLDKPVLVVLELGPVATNNYRLLNQLASYRDQFAEPLPDKGEIRLTEKASSVPMRLPQEKRAVMQKSVDTKVANERYFLELRGVRGSQRSRS